MDTRTAPRRALDDERQILTVTALNREARLIIEAGLGQVRVEGEISNLSRPSSGHMYFSLKDAGAQVRCAFFRQANRRLAFRLDNGQQVLVRGRVSLYELRGDYQLIVDALEPSGEGALRQRFEALKAKLAAEGLFDAAAKRLLPPFPTRIGVVTSASGAAVRDVLIALARRFPAVPVLIYPTSVQGQGAAAEIAAALARADRRADCDLLILTRGGGSLEDLWPFNEEGVARALAAMTIPTIVGVGHEVDFTIADFVADLRAPTPSQAAELAVPDGAALRQTVDAHADRLARAMRQRVREAANRSATLGHRLARAHPGVVLRASQQRIDELELRLRRVLGDTARQRRQRFERAAAGMRAASPRHRVERTAADFRAASARLGWAMQKRLDSLGQRLRLAEHGLRSLSPLATLERGYAIVSRADDGRILRGTVAVRAGDAISVRLAAGRLGATVTATDDGDGDSDGD